MKLNSRKASNLRATIFFIGSLILGLLVLLFPAPVIGIFLTILACRTTFCLWVLLDFAIWNHDDYLYFDIDSLSNVLSELIGSLLTIIATIATAIAYFANYTEISQIFWR